MRWLIKEQNKRVRRPDQIYITDTPCLGRTNRGGIIWGKVDKVKIPNFWLPIRITHRAFEKYQYLELIHWCADTVDLVKNPWVKVHKRDPNNVLGGFEGREGCTCWEYQGGFLEKAMHKEDKSEHMKKRAWEGHGQQGLVSKRRWYKQGTEARKTRLDSHLHRVLWEGRGGVRRAIHPPASCVDAGTWSCKVRNTLWGYMVQWLGGANWGSACPNSSSMQGGW